MQVAVIGPPGAGKSNYIAALTRARYAFGSRTRSVQVRPAAGDAKALALDQAAAEIILGRRILGATADVTSYRMIADLPGSSLFGIGIASVELELVDHPGGECLPQPGRRLSPLIERVLGRADGLVLILPADRNVDGADVTARVDNLLQQTRRIKSLSPAQPPFNRLCICLSMAELLVVQHGDGAFDALEATDPKAAVAQCYGPGIAALAAAAVPAGGDWYSMISVFGFDRQTGAAAIIRDGTGRWVPRTAPGLVNENWWPYRLFEPVEFMARGTCWRGVVEP